MPPTRPRRIVRQLAIALVLAATALVVAQWYSRQGVDQRFVGTWSRTSSANGTPTWTYGSNGHGELVAYRNGKHFTALRFRWKVSGTQLETSSYNDEQTLIGRIRREMQLMRMKFAGEPLWTERYDILEVGPNAITLKDEKNERLTMHRRIE